MLRRRASFPSPSARLSSGNFKFLLINLHHWVQSQSDKTIFALRRSPRINMVGRGRERVMGAAPLPCRPLSISMSFAVGDLFFSLIPIWSQECLLSSLLRRLHPFNLGWRELPSKVASYWLPVDWFGWNLWHVLPDPRSKVRFLPNWSTDSREKGYLMQLLKAKTPT